MKGFEKKELPKEKQLEFLKKIVKDIFGLNAEIDFKVFPWEASRVVIRDIDWSDDLVEVLKRLRSDFYIDIEPEIRVDTVDEKERNYAVLNITLYPVNEEEG